MKVPTDPFRLTKEENESGQIAPGAYFDERGQKRRAGGVVVGDDAGPVDRGDADRYGDAEFAEPHHAVPYGQGAARSGVHTAAVRRGAGKYYEAQQRYAQYVDQNQALSRRSFRTEEGVCRTRCRWLTASTTRRRSSCSWPGRRSRNRLRSTPWCSPRQSSLKPSKPSKMMILMGWYSWPGPPPLWLLFGKEFVGAFGETGKTDDSI